MKVSVTCASCGKTFKVDSQFVGKRGKCPNPECRQVYIVPSPDNDSETFFSQSTEKKTGRIEKKSLNWGESLRQPKPKTTQSKSWLARIDAASFFMGLSLSAIVAVAAFLSWPLIGTRPSSAAPQTDSQKTATIQTVVENSPILNAFTQKYCLGCHGADKPEAGISFVNKIVDQKALLKDRRKWERVFEIISSGGMPPRDEPQPSSDEKAKLLEFLDEKLHRIDCSQMSDPGRVTIRRLNRAEYNNTIRDLMGVTFRPADDFPSDDVGYGFDNIGDVLSLPPLLMEKYLNAAEKIVQEALLGVDTNHPDRKEFERDQLHRSSVAHLHGEDGLILVSVGDFHVDHDFPRSGDYLLRVSAAETPAGNEASKMEYRIDGKPIKVFEVTATEPKYAEFEFTIHLPAGRHKFAVAFLNDYYNEKAPDKNRRDRNLIVRDVQIIGPTKVDDSDYPAFHKSFIVARPDQGKSIAEAARENLRPFVSRAFRRSVSEEELTPFVRLTERITTEEETFITALQVAVSAVLVSPQFLFRIETDKNPNDANDRHPLNDFELASRLSYFLWSSMPDDDLMLHAEKGDLHTDSEIDRQVRRMLADPRSRALVDNFAEQWLQLRILNEITPDPKQFPEFNTELRDDMRYETSRFFEYVMREDRSILEFLDGTYTFVNERLARHYSIEGISGPEFQRVDLSGKSRAGLLTQGSILTLTSNPDRTSPVKRGKWVMEVLLNKPPPPPPPNVPELKETAKAQPNMTLRQQMELHRQNPSCSSCHRTMDQLGFGIENFDAIGRWRETDSGQPLDTRGELPGGQTFMGPLELAAVLRSKQCEFGECLAEKMLTYGLGRGLEFYDRCATAKILTSLKEHDFKFSVLIIAIVKSEPFRMRRGEASQTSESN